MVNSARIFLLATALMFIGWNKQDPPPVAIPVVPTSNLLYGGFIYNQNIVKTSPTSSITTQISPIAYFFNPPVDPNATFGLSYADVGAVSMNAVGLKKLQVGNGSVQYIDSTGGINTVPVSVSISGSGGFAAMSFTDNNFPSISNFEQMPQVISKSAGVTIMLNNLVNTTMTEITIGNVTQSTQSNSLTFSASQLSSFSPGGSTILNVKCFNMPPVGYTVLGDKRFANVYITEYQISQINITN
jgi:hypothetical protein